MSLSFDRINSTELQETLLRTAIKSFHYQFVSEINKTVGRRNREKHN